MILQKRPFLARNAYEMLRFGQMILISSDYTHAGTAFESWATKLLILVTKAGDLIHTSALQQDSEIEQNKRHHLTMVRKKLHAAAICRYGIRAFNLVRIEQLSKKPNAVKQESSVKSVKEDTGVSSTDALRSGATGVSSTDALGSGATGVSSTDALRSGATGVSSTDALRSGATGVSSKDALRSGATGESSTDGLRGDAKQR